MRRARKIIPKDVYWVFSPTYWLPKFIYRMFFLSYYLLAYTWRDDVTLLPHRSFWIIKKGPLEAIAPTPLQAEDALRMMDDYQRLFEINRGDTVVDVGAGLGLTSVNFARKVGREGSVLAIEPHPLRFKRLVDWADSGEQNGIIRTVNKAAWSKRDTLEIDFPFALPPYSAEVEADTVDNILKNLGVERVDFLKIAVGTTNVIRVLDGMKETLKNTEKVVIRGLGRGETASSCRSILCGYCFRVRILKSMNYPHEFLYAWRGRGPRG